MPILVIVESPGKTKKINSILGSEYLVRASFGHIRDLAAPTRPAAGSPAQPARPGSNLGVDIEAGWVPHWDIVAGKERIASELRRAGRAGVVYLATDLDREGEAIAWHLRELLGGSEDRFRRVTFSEITPDAVRAAFAAPRGIDYDLVRAQQARRFLDRLVGFTVSPLLSGRLDARLSAGRVQSAALRILVDRDEQIRVFVPAEFFGIDVVLALDGADDVTASVLDADGSVRRFDDRADADRLSAEIAAADVALDKVDAVDVTQRPKPPFTTSTLQQAASSLLKFSVSDTMALAQKLYEAGRITYMRSDAVFVAEGAQTAARSWLTAAFGVDAVPEQPPVYAAKAGAQEAHEAIRPTDVTVGPEAVPETREAALYDLIRRRLLASQMAPARIRRTSWHLSALTAAGVVPLVAKGRVVVSAGFHLVLPPASAVDEPAPVPDLQAGVVWPAGAARPEVSTSWTKPPPRYTEASLVAELESAGVGRPSTYANILKVLVDRVYVLLDGRVFVVTPLGRLVTDRLNRHFPQVTDIGFTASLEASLDRIAAGKLVYQGMLDAFYGTLTTDLAAAQRDPDFQPPVPRTLPGSCLACGTSPILRFDRGFLRVLCARCRSCGELEWSPKRARRTVKKVESGDKAVAEQAAADQRLQSRCSVCGGSQQRWKVTTGGYLHLCQAWPRCAGALYEPGRAPAASSPPKSKSGARAAGGRAARKSAGSGAPRKRRPAR